MPQVEMMRIHACNVRSSRNLNLRAKYGGLVQHGRFNDIDRYRFALLHTFHRKIHDVIESKIGFMKMVIMRTCDQSSLTLMTRTIHQQY